LNIEADVATQDGAMTATKMSIFMLTTDFSTLWRTPTIVMSPISMIPASVRIQQAHRFDGGTDGEARRGRIFERNL
jgi:hypothetical protein